MNGFVHAPSTQGPPQVTLHRFNRVLPSVPLSFPFGGDYAAVSAVYDLDAVMGLDDRRDELLHDLLVQERAIVRSDLTDLDEFNKTWEGQEMGGDYDVAAEARLSTYRANNERVRAIEQQMEDILIAHVLIRFETTLPTLLPSPLDAAELRETFSPHVLAWLVAPSTLTEVAQQVKSPKLKTK